jgi:hypothetical protein
MLRAFYLSLLKTGSKIGETGFSVNLMSEMSTISAAYHLSFGSIMSIHSSALVCGELCIRLTKLHTPQMETGCSRPTTVNKFLFPVERFGTQQAKPFWALNTQLLSTALSAQHTDAHTLLELKQ